jgi:outer membrane protein assembly factor BamB
MMVLVCGVAATVEDAGNWPNWRGPGLDGSSPATGLPAKWSRTEGILWRTQMPGPGNSTPVLWGDRMFLTSVDSESGTVLAMCVEAGSGDVLWKHRHGKIRRRGRNDSTSPSPVTDGERVVFMFGSGELVGYDHAGKRLWRRDLKEEFGALSWLFGYGASPLLHNGRLYVQMMRRPKQGAGEPFLLALDPDDGKDLWRHRREAEAVGESWESYMTPTIHASESGERIVLVGADAITGHDPETGRERWRYTYNAQRRRNWRMVPTPVSDGERLYTTLPRGGSLVALRPREETAPLSERRDWVVSRYASDVCSPLLYRGKLYVLDGNRRVLTCLDPATGDQIWRGELGRGGTIRSSPTAADGKIYFIDESGLVYVVAAEEEFRVLSEIRMGGAPARSSIVMTAGRLYVRTGKVLYCIGSRGDEGP